MKGEIFFLHFVYLWVNVSWVIFSLKIWTAYRILTLGVHISSNSPHYMASRSWLLWVLSSSGCWDISTYCSLWFSVFFLYNPKGFASFSWGFSCVICEETYILYSTFLGVFLGKGFQVVWFFIISEMKVLTDIIYIAGLQ